MIRYFVALVIAIALFAPQPLWSAADDPGARVPTMKSLAPPVAKPGGVVVVTGEFLGKNRVAEVFLTKGGTDTKVDVIAQTNVELKFRVPEAVEVGRYGLTVLTADVTPLLLDQPVFLSVQKDIAR